MTTRKSKKFYCVLVKTDGGYSMGYHFTKAAAASFRRANLYAKQIVIVEAYSHYHALRLAGVA
jgi:hypothetical protein